MRLSSWNERKETSIGTPNLTRMVAKLNHRKDLSPKVANITTTANGAILKKDCQLLKKKPKNKSDDDSVQIIKQQL